MKMEVDIDRDELDKYLVDELRYWSKKKNHANTAWCKEDKKANKKIRRAAKVMLDWYGG